LRHYKTQDVNQNNTLSIFLFLDNGLNDSSTSNDSSHPLFPECRVELRPKEDFS
jgi:hypothetical protein